VREKGEMPVMSMGDYLQLLIELLVFLLSRSLS
jgi:hypothetical protein